MSRQIRAARTALVFAKKARTKVTGSYVKQFSKVLAGVKVAGVYQIENKLDAVVRYEMAGQIPLVKQ